MYFIHPEIDRILQEHAGISATLKKAALEHGYRLTSPACLVVLALSRQAQTLAFLEREKIFGTNLNYNINLLERNGLTRRMSQTDRRIKLVVLTAKGRDLANKLREVAGAWVA
jgi:DNA-binding MarR family transcriptional regulator